MKMKLLLMSCVLGLVAGCKIAIMVPSGGDVVSSNAAHNCAEGNVCEFEINTGQLPFSETLTAIPKAGYVFEKWSDGGEFQCGKSTTPTCTISIADSAVGFAAVSLFDSGYAMPIFKDVGIDTDGDGVRNELDEDDDNDGISDIDDPCPLEPNPDCATNELSGIYYEDLYLRKEDGPYVVVGDVTIPEFFNFNIEAGAEVRWQSGTIRLFGNLYIAGTQQEPVSLDQPSIELFPQLSSIVNINHAKFNCDSFSKYVIEGTLPNQVTISNSLFTSCKNRLYHSSTSGDPLVLIEKNIFDRSSSVFSGRLNIRNNLFFGDVPHGQNAEVRLVRNPLFNQNTILFHPSTGGAGSVISVEYNSATGPDIDATNNYWGTTDYRVIDLIIVDENDLSNPGYPALSYLPFLDTPHPDTPTSP